MRAPLAARAAAAWALACLLACKGDGGRPAQAGQAGGEGEGEGGGGTDGEGEGEPGVCDRPPIDDGLSGGGDADIGMGGDHLVPGLGERLDVLLGTLLEAGATAAGDPVAPVVQVFPRSGPFGTPMGLRLCVSDENGLADLDPAGVRLRFSDGKDHARALRWSRTGPRRICGRVLSADTTVGGDVFGYRVTPRWPAVVEATVTDRGGLQAVAAARYEFAEPAPVRFEEVARAAGLAPPGKGYGGNTHTLGPTWLDADGDTWPDVYFPNGAGADGRLYRNQGDGTFADVTQAPLPLRRFEGAAALAADVDNDGDDDLYVLSDHPVLAVAGLGEQGLADNPVPGHRSHLLLNHGGCWRDAAEGGAPFDVNEDGQPYRTIAGAFADYDRDGCVDLYLVHWRLGGAVEPQWEQDRLYRGDCAGGFTDVTAAAGLDGYSRNGLAVLFADLDMDGWPDLYVVNVNEGQMARAPTQRDDAAAHWGEERGDDVLFRNRGDGTFEDVTAAAGVGRDAFAGMGIDAADFDGDGDYDLYLTDLDEPVGYGNVLYRSLVADTGELRFVEQAFELGSQPLSGDFGWGVVWGDFNLDTHPDLFYVGNSSRWLFLNTGAGDFDAVTGPVGFLFGAEVGLPDEVSAGKGVATADYDRDGLLDVLVVLDDIRRHLYPPLLIRNVSPRGDRHFLEVGLVGRRSNRSAIGAEVRAHLDPPGGRYLTRQVIAGHSSHSQSDRVLHFGLGAAARVPRLEVRWPSGEVQVLEDVAADRLLVLEEPAPPDQ